MRPETGRIRYGIRIRTHPKTPKPAHRENAGSYPYAPARSYCSASQAA